MRRLKLSQEVYEKYKRYTRDNKEISKEQAALKFYRNMRLGILSVRPKGKGTYVMYGNLHYIVNDDDVVVWMRNNCPPPEGWKRDKKRYLELNKELGIEEDVTMLDLITRDMKYCLKKTYGRIKWKFKRHIEVSKAQ